MFKHISGPSSSFSILWLIFLVMLYVIAPKVAIAQERKPEPPVHSQVLAADSHLPEDERDPAGAGTLPTDVNEPLNPTSIYNDLIVRNLPLQSNEAETYVIDGPSVLPKVTNMANGATLSYSNTTKPIPCVDFNDPKKWASQRTGGSAAQVRATADRYAGWGPFAVDDGGFYKADYVTFSFDAAHGNGLSAKIASNQPYAAGLGSPLIPIKAGSSVTVKVRYLMANPGLGQAAYDWVSLGIKPDAMKEDARYVSGYARGEWALLENSSVANGEYVMVLVQAHSPAAINSNVYFDDIEIFINEVALESCES